MKIFLGVVSLGKKVIDDEIGKVAALLAYYSLLSFFPFMIFLLTLVGYSKIHPQDLINALGSYLPSSAYDLIKSVVLDTVYNSNQNLLSFGILFALLSGSGGVRAVIDGLNSAYNVKENRNFVYLFFMSIVYTVALAILIIACFTLIVFGEVLGNGIIKWFNFKQDFKYFWDFYRVAVPLLLLFVMFIMVYKAFPAKRLKLKRVIPGALFTTFGWFSASTAFAYYVNNFGNYSRVYGSIGAVIVLMTWIYIIAMIILIGGEINAFLANKN